MPMPNMPGVTPNPMSGGGANKKNIIIAVVVVVVVIILGYLMSRGGDDKNTNNNTPNNGQPTAQQPGTNNPTPNVPNQPVPATPPPAPTEVFSYVGEVSLIGASELKVLAKPVVNYLDKEVTLSVTVDSSTQIIRRTIPKVIPKEGGANLFKQETIKLSDIAKGDQVTVVSASNIKGKTDFTASRIEVLNVK